jgi:hypothetical protein
MKTGRKVIAVLTSKSVLSEPDQHWHFHDAVSVRWKLFDCRGRKRDGGTRCLMPWKSMGWHWKRWSFSFDGTRARVVGKLSLLLAFLYICSPCRPSAHKGCLPGSGCVVSDPPYLDGLWRRTDPARDKIPSVIGTYRRDGVGETSAMMAQCTGH